MPGRAVLWPSLVLLLGLISASPAAWADIHDDLRRCVDPQDLPERRMARCNAAIDAHALPPEQEAAAFNHRALAWLALGKQDEAVKDLDRAIQLNPKYMSAYNSRGIAHSQLGDYPKAVQDFDSAIALKPDYAYAYANRGLAWLSQGQPDRAITDLDEAVRLKPMRYEGALKARGMAWQAKGDLDRAMADFDAALKLNPGYAKGLVSRAYVHLAKGNFSAAVDDFAQAQKTFVDPYADLGLFLARLRLGKPDEEAPAAFRKTYGIDAWPAPVMGMLAGGLKPDEVIDRATQPGGRQQERTCTAYFYVGEWYLAQGKADAARTPLQRAGDACSPSSPEYSIARAEMERLK